MSGKPAVAVVGGANVDMQGKSFAPFRPADSNPGALTVRAGGVGRNIAENLARLGAEVQLVAALGDDELSSVIESSCAEAGVGLGSALRLRGMPSSRYLCLLDSNGALAGAVADMAAADSLLPERLAERSALLDAADFIVVDANIPEASIRWIAERYKGAPRPRLAFDPVSVTKAARGKDCLGSFAFAKPNRSEAAVLAGLELPPGKGEGASPSELAAALLAKGLGAAFVSLGAGGILAAGRGGGAWTARLPAAPRPGFEPVNSSGAGDAACAAIVLGLIRGESLGELCSLAMAAAGIAAASESPVNPAMSDALLREFAKGIPHERAS